MAYSVSPDGPPAASYDPEAGDGAAAPLIKSGGFRSPVDLDDRAAEREHARDLDATVELTALTRARRDLERAFPRPAVDVVSPRRRRTLPIPDAVRIPISARQRNARSRSKNITQTRLPRVGYTAVQSLITDESLWHSTANALTAAVGDAQHLDDPTRIRVQRVDRAIRTAETGTDRDHVLYCAARLPVPVPVPATAAELPAELQPGTGLDFDRFTMTAHDVHQIDPHLRADDVVFEMLTARGMYLGGSDRIDDTTHLLPRGMRFEVVGAGQGRYRRPDGTMGRRMIVQLRDITEGQ